MEKLRTLAKTCVTVTYPVFFADDDVAPLYSALNGKQNERGTTSFVKFLESHSQIIGDGIMH